MLDRELITTKKLKIAAVSFLTFILAVILYLAITGISHIGKVAVEIKYAPFEAAVFLNDMNYPVNNAVNWLEPGQYHVTVVLDGFQTLEEDVEITKNTKSLLGALTALNPDDTELYQKYQKDYLQLEIAGGKESVREAENLVAKWPILDYLPVIKNNYSIGSLFDEDDNLIVTVHADPTQIDAAINQLRSFKDIKLSNYNIIINDFKNELSDRFVDNDNSNPTAFLQSGYQNLTLPYKVNEGQQSGDYYYATISVGKYAGYIPVTYRIILQKTDSSWQLVGTPYPILTTYNTPNIDKAIIEAANQLNASNNS